MDESTDPNQRRARDFRASVSPPRVVTIPSISAIPFAVAIPFADSFDYPHCPQETVELAIPTGINNGSL